MDGISHLQGTVKHYEWGGYSFIPSLLAVKNNERTPFAEYWLGVHPQAECMVVQPDGSTSLLRDYLADGSPAVLGDFVAQRFGHLPYLLKALDVKDMLSIQVHPAKAAAEREYMAENEKGVAIDSPQRNYKDQNHKPELMVAMGGFWLLHGFKPEQEMLHTLQSLPELASLLPVFEIAGYDGLYRRVMEMPQPEVNLQLKPLLERIVPLYNGNKLPKSSPDYWAAKAALDFNRPGKTDRGIFSIYLFNLVYLQKGEAIFQDAGVPHAYLEGQNVEIMASSDNVLRGGLTSKHIDVPELLKHVKCEATHPFIIKGEKKGMQLWYKTPAPDFELTSFSLQANDHASFRSHTAEILLLVEGEVSIKYSGGELTLRKGQPSAVILPGNELTLGSNQPSWLFRSTVPVSAVDK